MYLLLNLPKSTEVDGKGLKKEEEKSKEKNYVSGVTCQCQGFCVTCHMLRVTGHRSLTPTATEGHYTQKAASKKQN